MLYGVPHRVLNRPAESSRGDGINQASAKLATLDEEHNVQKKQHIVAEEKIQKLLDSRTQVIRFENIPQALTCSFANYDSFFPEQLIQNNCLAAALCSWSWRPANWRKKSNWSNTSLV
jgi:hypothetical protein